MSGGRAKQQKTRERLKLLVFSPGRFDAVLLDRDGVVTDTAQAHAAAWKRLFDYRRVKAVDVEKVERVVDQVLAQQPTLGRGKKVFQVQPRTDWDKAAPCSGCWSASGSTVRTFLPLYIGDDVTDEDAFRALHDRGLGIVIRDTERLAVMTDATLVL